MAPMNPLLWKREHHFAAALMAIIGAVLGVLAGYFVYVVPSNGGLRFGYWISSHLSDAISWMLVGAMVGFGLIYVRQLLKCLAL